MSTVQFTVADDVVNDFNQLFQEDKQDAVIEKLMRQIISVLKQQDRRRQAFQFLTERKTLRPSVSQNEIEQVHDEVVRIALQYSTSSEEKTFNPQKRTLGLLEDKGHFKIKDNFKMTDEELLLS